MAISNSWLDRGLASILAGIQGLELNASGGGGGGGYKYVVCARISMDLQETMTLIPGTPDLVNREVTVRLISGSLVCLKWKGMEIEDYNFLQITPEQPEYRDTSDGGIELKGFSLEENAVVVVVVRQQEPINYEIGGKKEVADVGVNSVSLLVNTNAYYADAISDWDLETQINNFTGSDEYISGHKIFLINSSPAGKPITFNIDAGGVGFGGSKIEMQLIKPFELISLLFHTGINQYLWDYLPDFLSSGDGFSKIFKYGGKTSSADGGELSVTPDLGIFAGRFVAQNAFNGLSDTCIITDYQPNTEDSTHGGTFTLGGF